MPNAAEAPKLLKISALARESGVPAATIKHYLREGLLPGQHVKTSRNVALYDRAVVERVKTIKELQRTRFLPLKVIKGVLDGDARAEDEATAAAIASVLEELASTRSKTRAELVAAGMPEAQLDFFRSIGAVTPDRAAGEERYSGDDLALLQTLGEARKAGLTAEMLPAEILEPYVRAIRELVRTELRIFREGVVPRAGRDLGALTESATKLSEQLVVLLRRKMLLPTLRQLLAEAAPPARPASSRPRTTGEQTKPAKKTTKAKRPRARGGEDR